MPRDFSTPETKPLFQRRPLFGRREEQHEAAQKDDHHKREHAPAKHDKNPVREVAHAEPKKGFWAKVKDIFTRDDHDEKSHGGRSDRYNYGKGVRTSADGKDIYVDHSPKDCGKISKEHAEFCKNNPGVIAYRERSSATFSANGGRPIPVSYGVFAYHDGHTLHVSPPQAAGGLKSNTSSIGGAPAGVKHGTGNYDERHRCVTRPYIVTMEPNGRGGNYAGTDPEDGRKVNFAVHFNGNEANSHRHEIMGHKPISYRLGEGKRVHGLSLACFIPVHDADMAETQDFYKIATSNGRHARRLEMIPSMELPDAGHQVAAWRNRHDEVYIAQQRSHHNERVHDLAKTYRINNGPDAREYNEPREVNPQEIANAHSLKARGRNNS